MIGPESTGRRANEGATGLPWGRGVSGKRTVPGSSGHRRGEAVEQSIETLRRARARKFPIVLTSDAHRADELQRVDYAARNAEKAWLDRDRVANTWGAKTLAAWATGGKSALA